MVDLSDEIADLWSALGAPGAARPRIVQIVAARRGEGTSTVARELAHFASRRAMRSVWLIDLDVFAGAQYAAISSEAERYGQLGPAVSASPNGSMFFALRPQATGTGQSPMSDAKYLSAYRVGDARWWVTRFRSENLYPGQNLHVLRDPKYWSSLREHADLIIVDCPSLDRSKAALTLARNMDETVIVVAADEPEVAPPLGLRGALTEEGATIAGLFFNRVGGAQNRRSPSAAL